MEITIIQHTFGSIVRCFLHCRRAKKKENVNQLQRVVFARLSDPRNFLVQFLHNDPKTKLGVSNPKPEFRKRNSQVLGELRVSNQKSRVTLVNFLVIILILTTSTRSQRLIL